MKHTAKRGLIPFFFVLWLALALPALAEGEGALRIDYTNLSFSDSVYIKYAVETTYEDTAVLIWTTVPERFEKGSEQYVLAKEEEQTISGKTYDIYNFKALSAKQMTDVVYARAYAEDGGAPVYGELKKYSVLQYAYNMLGKTAAGSENEKLKVGLSKMLEYGAAMQDYFGYETARMATADFYAVTVQSGTLDLDGTAGGLFTAGERVALSAPETDKDGNVFTHWVLSDGSVLSDSPRATLTVPAVNITVTAKYDVPFDYEGYQSLTPIPSDSFENAVAGYEWQSVALSVPLPSALDADMEGGSLMLSRGGRAVGELTSRDIVHAPGTRVMESSRGRVGDVAYYYELLAIPTAVSPEGRFRHCVTYTYDVEDILYSLTLLMDYTELDAAALTECTTGAALIEAYSDAKLGSLLHGGQSTPRSVLVLGNSFIGSSQIGSFLDTMFSGTGYTVSAVSRGYACPCRGTWDDYLPRIMGGEFDVLFLCGFYHAEDTTVLATFVEACRTSGTRLVLFPAHNESREQAAIDAYPEIPVIHWQDEINLLMDKLGIGLWDFCIDDSHKHSTPLAGYVGAHMIYRALTGRIPTATSFAPIATSVMEEKLGSYMSTGRVPPPGDVTVWLFR